MLSQVFEIEGAFTWSSWQPCSWSWSRSWILKSSRTCGSIIDNLAVDFFIEDRLQLLFGQSVQWHSHEFRQVIPSLGFLVFCRPASIQRFFLGQLFFVALVSYILEWAFKAWQAKQRRPGCSVEAAVEDKPEHDCDAWGHNFFNHDVKVEDGSEQHQVPETDKNCERAKESTNIGSILGIVRPARNENENGGV